MGEEATKPEAEVIEEPVTDESSEDETGETQEAAPEIEVIREGGTGSQPDEQHGIRKRINKLNARVNEADGRAEAASADVALKDEKIKLLELALQQKSEGELRPPDPIDFDEGADDPKYIAGQNAYNRRLIAEEIQRQVPQTPAQANPEAERKQTKHYDRAMAMGAKDYGETEDKAIAVLGNETVKELIDASDNSHIVLYYLGKNPGEAEEIKQLLATNPVQGTLRLGRLEAELKVQPKGNVEPAPDPDEELNGGSPSSDDYLQKKYDAAIEKAMDGGKDPMTPVIAIKREAKERGITLKE